MTMTTLLLDTDTDTLRAARALAPELSERALETEQLGTLPRDLVEKARAAHLFGLLTPRALGGLELPPRPAVETLEELCRADGSAGWAILIGNATSFFSWFDPAIGAELFEGAAEPAGAGAFAPAGRLVDQGDGTFVLNGRWPFVSGCRHADRFLLGAFVMDGDQPRIIDGVGPDWRLAHVRAADVEIIDNWDVAGLRGTGSNDVAVSGVIVEDRHTIAPFGQPARHDTPTCRFPFFTLVGMKFAAVPLGIGRRALDELLAIAATKIRVGTFTPLGDAADVQLGMARADGALRAARAFVFESIDDAYATALAGDVPSVEQRARIQLAANNAMRAGLDAVDFAFATAGASALRNDNALQRCFRDLHAAAQHAYFSTNAWKRYTRVVLGTEREQLNML
jgi:alkylation response protein AidB-like acyl-CoA dehydrogenase